MSGGNLLKDVAWAPEFPYTKADFKRQIESADGMFYKMPRLVQHIDDAAIAALTQHYTTVLTPGADVLDLCSSWVSHYPTDFKGGRVAGLGMNEEELSKNPQLTEFLVQDLNKEPTLPFADNSFDVVTNCASVDYLVQPLEVFNEVSRVLRPGGLSVVAFSNRVFAAKAVWVWMRMTDQERVHLVGSFMHFAGDFETPEGLDLSPGSESDPLFVVQARKKMAS
jgi:SAM-dependent methyltransferase